MNMQYEKVIRKIFLKKLKAKKADIFDKSRGLEHKVFIVRTVSKEFVIRFPISIEENKLKVQKWAYERWAEIGIPVPKVVLIGRGYLIEEKIDGVDIGEANLSLPKQQKIMYELGKLVRKMHTIKTNGYGPLRSNGAGKYKTWKNFIATSFKRDLFIAKNNKYLPSSLLNKIKDFYDKRKDVLEYYNPRLLHNDLTYDNIIIKDDKINGIIDAGDCISGDPMYEFGFMNKHYFSKNVMESFYKGYEKADNRRVNFYTVIDCIPTSPKPKKNLKRLVEVINYYMDASN